MNLPTAPAGFLALGEAAVRVKEQSRCSGQKAEYKLVRAIMEGRIGMATLPGLTRLAPAEGMEFDFGASRVIGAPDDRQVIHLTISGLGDAGNDGGNDLFTTRLEPAPEGILVLLDEDDIEQLLDELAPRRAAAAGAVPYQRPAPPGDTTAAAMKRPAHRPPVYDWQFYETQARRRAFQHGLPEKSSVLVREILDLFCRRGEGPPEQRTVERKIEEWWPGLQALIEDLNALCEITPEVMLRRN